MAVIIKAELCPILWWVYVPALMPDLRILKPPVADMRKFLVELYNNYGALRPKGHTVDSYVVLKGRKLEEPRQKKGGSWFFNKLNKGSFFFILVFQGASSLMDLGDKTFTVASAYDVLRRTIVRTLE
ncbi:hypothetical protein Ancab_005076 [Ancistrocladus abbreviatus]